MNYVLPKFAVGANFNDWLDALLSMNLKCMHKNTVSCMVIVNRYGNASDAVLSTYAGFTYC